MKGERIVVTYTPPTEGCWTAGVKVGPNTTATCGHNHGSQDEAIICAEEMLRNIQYGNEALNFFTDNWFDGS